MKVAKLAFSPGLANLGLVSSRLVHPVANHEIYSLGMVAGPVFNKNKRDSLDCHTFGGENTKQIQTV